MRISSDDWELIISAKKRGGDVWNDDTIKPLKDRWKQYLLGRTKEQCCYCRKGFVDEFNMVIDIEHVLPKSKFPEFMFEFFNISVCCKRCNMRIKREKITFVSNLNIVGSNPRDRDLYLFIHPNLDVYSEHINYVSFVLDEKAFTKYVQRTKKGAFTYDFFELAKLEVATLNELQGIEDTQLELNPNMPANLVSACEKLIKELAEK